MGICMNSNQDWKSHCEFCHDSRIRAATDFRQARCSIPKTGIFTALRCEEESLIKEPSGKSMKMAKAARRFEALTQSGTAARQWLWRKARTRGFTASFKGRLTT